MSGIKECRTVEELKRIKGIRIVEKDSATEVRMQGRVIVRWDKELKLVLLNSGEGTKLVYVRINQALLALGLGIRISGNRIVENSSGCGVVWA